jgi:hypothetical protein
MTLARLALASLPLLCAAPAALAGERCADHPTQTATGQNPASVTMLLGPMGSKLCPVDDKTQGGRRARRCRSST